MTPRTNDWTWFPILNGEHCYFWFLAFISGTRGEKYLSALKVLMLAWWEFSNLCNPIRVSLCIYVFNSFRSSLTPVEET